MFFIDFYKFFQNIYSTEQLWMAAFGIISYFTLVPLL